mgnify:CR=1 FL=1
MVLECMGSLLATCLRECASVHAVSATVSCVNVLGGSEV